MKSEFYRNLIIKLEENWKIDNYVLSPYQSFSSILKDVECSPDLEFSPHWISIEDTESSSDDLLEISKIVRTKDGMTGECVFYIETLLQSIDQVIDNILTDENLEKIYDLRKKQDEFLDSLVDEDTYQYFDSQLDVTPF